MELSNGIKNTHCHSEESDLGTIIGNKHMIKPSGKQKPKSKVERDRKQSVKQNKSKEEEEETFFLLCLNHESCFYLHSQVSSVIYIFTF